MLKFFVHANHITHTLQMQVIMLRIKQKVEKCFLKLSLNVVMSSTQTILLVCLVTERKLTYNRKPHRSHPDSHPGRHSADPFPHTTPWCTGSDPHDMLEGKQTNKSNNNKEIYSDDKIMSFVVMLTVWKIFSSNTCL